MDNAVLRDHLYAIIKNAREMMKVPDYPPEQDQNPKRDKKVKQGVQVKVYKMFLHIVWFLQNNIFKHCCIVDSACFRPIVNKVWN